MTVSVFPSFLDSIKLLSDEKIISVNNTIHPNRLHVDWFDGDIVTVKKNNFSVTLTTVGSIDFAFAKKRRFATSFSLSDHFSSPSLTTTPTKNTSDISFFNDKELFEFKTQHDIHYFDRKVFDWSLFRYDDGNEQYFVQLNLRSYLETNNVISAIKETLYMLRELDGQKIKYKKRADGLV